MPTPQGSHAWEPKSREYLYLVPAQERRRCGSVTKLSTTASPYLINLLKGGGHWHSFPHAETDAVGLTLLDVGILPNNDNLDVVPRCVVERIQHLLEKSPSVFVTVGSVATTCFLRTCSGGKILCCFFCASTKVSIFLK